VGEGETWDGASALYPLEDAPLGMCVCVCVRVGVCVCVRGWVR